MKLFTVIAPGSAAEYAVAWEDTGFKLAEAEAWDDAGQRPDVFLWRWSRENDLPVSTILSLLPKLIVIISDKNEQITVSQDLSEIYSMQHFAGRDTGFTICTRLEGEVAVPDWNSYSNQGEITGEEQIKAATGSIYRFLLEDVIRETAEWCGHMSSVVGHM
ncbi:MAG: hypothetical protein PHY77_00795 [Desulfotomaculaceae bacterium]|nr:hypothetical protein [Desulfotomaculaceae bacterium]